MFFVTLLLFTAIVLLPPAKTPVTVVRYQRYIGGSGGGLSVKIRLLYYIPGRCMQVSVGACLIVSRQNVPGEN